MLGAQTKRYGEVVVKKKSGTERLCDRILLLTHTRTQSTPTCLVSMGKMEINILGPLALPCDPTWEKYTRASATTKVVPVANRAWVGSSSPSDPTIDLEAITCCSILISRQPQVKLQFARKEGRLGRLENVINTDNTISLLLCKMAITYRDSLKPGHKLFVFLGFLRRAGIKPDHTQHTRTIKTKP